MELAGAVGLGMAAGASRRTPRRATHRSPLLLLRPRHDEHKRRWWRIGAAATSGRRPAVRLQFQRLLRRPGPRSPAPAAASVSISPKTTQTNKLVCLLISLLPLIDLQ